MSDERYRSTSPDGDVVFGGENGGKTSAQDSPARSRSRSSHSRSRSRSPRYKRRSYSRSRSRSRSRRRRKSSSRSFSRSRSRSFSPRRKRKNFRSRSRSPLSNRKRHQGDRYNPKPSRVLGLFGLSLYTGEKDLKEILNKYGHLERVQVVYDHQTGRSRGFAFVYFKEVDDAMDAKENLNGTELDGRRLRVDYSITKRPHTPTPGVYMGRPTRSGGEGDDGDSRERDTRDSKDSRDRDGDRDRDRDRDRRRDHNDRGGDRGYDRGGDRGYDRGYGGGGDHYGRGRSNYY